MPSLDNLATSAPVKMLMIGDSGTGKTGALTSLVKAGYKLRIQDYDNGLDILVSQIKKLPNGAELLKTVKYLPLQDKLKAMAGNVVPVGTPNAFQRGLEALNKWEDGDDKLGSVMDWGKDTILVIDSMTLMSNAALRRVLALGGHSGKNPEIQEWGEAMRQVEETLALLYSDYIKCHVIIISHITYIETEGGKNAGYPSTLGNKLPPKVGRYFNTVVQVKKSGTGTNVKRVILTQPTGTVEVKCPWVFDKSELPIETGLAELFAAATGSPTAPKASA